MSERLSRLLSYVLRHGPGEFGLKLAEGGWVSVDLLLHALSARGHVVTLAELEAVVRMSDKQRFAFSEDGARIRANQGHSVDVDLRLEPSVPPEKLFHGTVTRFLPSIRAGGLMPGSRHHVHLSPDVPTATAVGARRGRPVILEIAAGALYRAGQVFFRSENGVWLTDHVPAGYIEFPNPSEE